MVRPHTALTVSVDPVEESGVEAEVDTAHATISPKICALATCAL